MKNIVLFLLFYISTISCNNTESGKIEVLTLGTIHSQHIKSHYGYNDVIDALATFNPDLICVEIRPEDFRKEYYLVEMMLATTYGDVHNIPVVPIDYWDANNNNRLIRDSLGKIDKYIRLLRIADSLETNNVLLKNFKNKFEANGDNIYRNYDLGIDFWNGKEYNDYVRESYKISISIFGDSPFNLNYISRNSKMLTNIKLGIKKYNAKKVIVLTGAEHKSIFDDSLKMDKSILVTSLTDIEPLNHSDFGELLKRFRPCQYFTKADSLTTEKFYTTLIMPYVHGPDMDFYISNIDLRNLPLVYIILKNWESDAPNSLNLVYDWAWYYFLKKDYDTSIKYCNQYILKKDYHDLVFDRGTAYRMLGFCYDLKNQRQKAIEYYKKAREEFILSKKPDWQIKALLEDYESKPYSR
ncbi:MAG TPA: tetratricopeptide repeat protein [Bacteroidales bacterium]|nr:tetratricopeptide repeat protein [Bacteroidales bacterium]